MTITRFQVKAAGREIAVRLSFGLATEAPVFAGTLAPAQARARAVALEREAARAATAGLELFESSTGVPPVIPIHTGETPALRDPLAVALSVSLPIQPLDPASL